MDAATRKSLRILIADDAKDTLRMLSVILQHEGHVVHSVTHGGIVLEAVRRFQPQVCILDMQMPGKTGYEVASDISAAFQDKTPLLIAISGKWTSDDESAGRAVGFRHFLQKPAHPADLFAILDGYDAG